MIVLLHKARTVGAVCNYVARQAPNQIRVCKDEDYEAREGDLVIRWDSAAPIFDAVELQSAKAIKRSRNKSASRVFLGPLAPTTWFDTADVELPAIVRPKRHHAGKHFYVVNNRNELRKAVTRSGHDWYASPILNKADEYRVYVLQGHVISVSKRRVADKDQIAWNVAQGAEMFKIKRATWPLDVVRTAISAADKLELKWAAVDVCVTKDGAIVVFELNTAPGLVPTAKSLPLIAKSFIYADSHRKLEGAKLDSNTFNGFLHPALRKS